jgi:hypothetical protein
VAPAQQRPRTRLAAVPVGDGHEAVIWRYDDDGTTDVSPGAPGIYSTLHWQPRDPSIPDVHPVPDGVIVTGELIPGAEAVEVRGPVEPRDVVTAGGHYLAMLPFAATEQEVLVAFRDAAGRVIRHDEPGELERGRIEDADAPCGACGGREWDYVEHRSGPGSSHTRVRTVVCATCGHRVGGHQLVGRRRRSAEHDAFDYDSPFPEDAAPAEIVDGMPFAVYGVANAGGTRRLRSHGSEGDRPRDCSLSYRRRAGGKKTSVVVESGPEVHRGVDDEYRARSALQSAIASRDWSDTVDLGGSFDAMTVRVNARRRDASGRAARAPARACTIAVDGEPRQFTRVDDAETGFWAATTTLDGRELTVTAVGIAPDELELARVTDAAAYLGPNARRT